MSVASHGFNTRGFAVSLNGSLGERDAVVFVISNPRTTEHGIAAQHVLALPSILASLASLVVHFVLCSGEFCCRGGYIETTDVGLSDRQRGNGLSFDAVQQRSDKILINLTLPGLLAFGDLQFRNVERQAQAFRGRSRAFRIQLRY